MLVYSSGGGGRRYSGLMIVCPLYEGLGGQKIHMIGKNNKGVLRNNTKVSLALGMLVIDIYCCAICWHQTTI